MFRGKTFLFGCFLLLFLPASVLSALDGRFKYLGSANINMPTGYVRSQTEYISDHEDSLGVYSQKLMGRLFEVSALKFLNGKNKDAPIFNLKVNILEEGRLLPNCVWGTADFQNKLGSKIFYLAGSKNIDAFGLTLHGGFLKDPVTTKKKYFWGAEKVILPLVVLAGENLEESNAFGIKIRPYPGLNIEYSIRNSDGKFEQ